MVDTGLAFAIVKRLNRYYRKRAKSHAKADHYNRGIRMTPTAAKRVVSSCMWLFILAVVVAFFFVPNLFSGKSLFEILVLKAGWLMMAGMVLLMPLIAVLDFAVITEDGVIRPKLFGGQERFAWSDIVSVQMEPDGDEVIFIAGSGRKCKISLAYDGWQDLLETASKHLPPPLYNQFVFLQSIESQRMRPANESKV